MGKQLAVAQIFEYCPEAISLEGFPHSRILDALGTTLGREVSLRAHQSEANRRQFLMPSFPLQYVTDRQRFFRRLPQNNLSKFLFEREFPKREDAGHSAKDFLCFCEHVYKTLEAAREELKPFRHTPEARAVLRRLDDFDSDLEATLHALNAIGECTAFAVDLKNGVMVPIDKMPIEASNACYKADISRTRGEHVGDRIFGRVSVNMQKAALKIAKQGAVDFKKRIVEFVGGEFGFNPEVDNLRKSFEQLAVPVRLYARYGRFLEECEYANEGYCDEGELELPMHEIASPIYPRFGAHYEIKNLFPLSLSDRWHIPEFVPIDFKTKRGETKFLLAGLHSGGKSFFLENLVLTSILAQIGVSMPADSLTLPAYSRISYYRNVENSGNGAGKAEREIMDIEEIRRRSKRGDLVVLDEFLDSADASVATWLGPNLLRMFRETDATVFISTHRSHNYHGLERSGWTVMSPDYRIIEGKVVPAYRLKHSIPNGRINRRYMEQRVGHIFEEK